MKPSDYLNEAIKAIGDRAAERDIDEERSAGRAADMFSALTGRTMTELEAWQFMCCLKLVRSATGKYKADDFIDLAGYAALAGEAAQKSFANSEKIEGWIKHDGSDVNPVPGKLVLTWEVDEKFEDSDVHSVVTRSDEGDWELVYYYKIVGDAE